MKEKKMKEKKSQVGEIFAAIFIFVVIIGVIIGFMGFDTVDASHIGVKVKFGEIQGLMYQGMQWTGLFVDVVQYDLRLRKMSVSMQGNDGSVDKDGQSVYADIEINYKLNPQNVQDIYSQVGIDKNGFLEETLNINSIVKEGFKTITSQYSSLEIFQKRNEIKEKAIAKIKENFPKDYFQLENVIVSNIDFNPAFKSAIEQKKVAEEMAKTKEQEVFVAQQQAQIDIANAEGQKQIKMKQSEAEAYQIERLAQAEAKALELKKEQLTPLMVQNNWIDRWDGSLPTYMLGQDTNLLMNMPSNN